MMRTLAAIALLATLGVRCESALAADASTAKVTYLASFKKVTGTRPAGGLAFPGDGNYYGVLTTGGEHGLGTVYRSTPAGKITVMHAFDGTDGSIPYARLLVANDGALYGTTYYSTGNLDDGVVYRITLDGNFTVLHAFDQACGSSSALIQGRDGNLYGLCSDGGTSSAGFMYRLSLAGDFAVIANLAIATGHAPLGSLLEGDDGTFYATASEGGANDFGSLISIAPDGTVTDLYDFKNLADGERPASTLIYSPSHDRLMGTTQGADSTGTLFQFKDGVLSTLRKFSSQSIPSSLTIGPDGATYFGYAGSAVFSYSADGHYEVITSLQYAQFSFDAPTFIEHGPLIGTTYADGSHNDGEVFRIDGLK